MNTEVIIILALGVLAVVIIFARGIFKIHTDNHPIYIHIDDTQAWLREQMEKVHERERKEHLKEQRVYDLSELAKNSKKFYRTTDDLMTLDGGKSYITKGGAILALVEAIAKHKSIRNKLDKDTLDYFDNLTFKKGKITKKPSKK